MPRLPGGGKDTRIQKVYFWGGFFFSGMRQMLGKRNDSRQKMPHLFRTRRFQKKRGDNGQSSSGIRDGEAISLPGLGEAVAGGTAGDLYVKFTVGKHPIFRRDNLNLVMDLDVKMSEALLGVEKDIMTLDGLIKLKVPAGINSEKCWPREAERRSAGTRFVGARGRGDLMIRIAIRTPKRFPKKPKI